jgi:uncharacterized membrane protein
MSLDAQSHVERGELSSADGSKSLKVTRAGSRYYEGVLPPPEMLAQYEALNPGMIAWMMKRVEDQQAHRMEIERVAVKESFKQASRGQIFAFLLGLVTLFVAAFGFWVKQPLAGFGSVVVGIGSIAGAFYISQKQESRERVKKDAQLHGASTLQQPSASAETDAETGKVAI